MTNRPHLIAVPTRRFSIGIARLSDPLNQSLATHDQDPSLFEFVVIEPKGVVI